MAYINNIFDNFPIVIFIILFVISNLFFLVLKPYMAGNKFKLLSFFYTCFLCYILKAYYLPSVINFINHIPLAICSFKSLIFAYDFIHSEPYIGNMLMTNNENNINPQGNTNHGPVNIQNDLLLAIQPLQGTIPLDAIIQIPNPSRINGLESLISYHSQLGHTMINKGEILNILVQSTSTEISDLRRILTDNQIRELVQNSYTEDLPVNTTLARKILFHYDPLSVDIRHRSWLASRLSYFQDGGSPYASDEELEITRTRNLIQDRDN